MHDSSNKMILAYPWEQAKQPSESARTVGALLGPHVGADEDFRNLESGLRLEVADAESSGDAALIYRAHHRLGIHLEARGSLGQAERAMREAALVTVDNSELSLSHLAALNDHGVVLARIGRLEEAEENFNRASQRIGNREKSALVLAVKRNQGLMAWISKDPTLGLDLWADAFRSSRTADDAGANAQTLNNVGVLRLLEGEGDEALQLFNRAILLAQRGGDLRSLVFAYNNLGLTFSGPPRGDHIAAIPFVEMALALLTGPLDILVRLYVLNNNIIVYEQAHLEPARRFRAQFAESLRSFTCAYPQRRADVERAIFARGASNVTEVDLPLDDEWEISADPVLLRAGARCGVQT